MLLLASSAGIITSNKMKLMSKKTKKDITTKQKTEEISYSNRRINLKEHRDISKLTLKNCTLSSPKFYGNSTIINRVQRFVIINTNNGSISYEKPKISDVDSELFCEEKPQIVKIVGHKIICDISVIFSTPERSATKIMFYGNTCDDETLRTLHVAGFRGSIVLTNNDLVTDSGLNYIKSYFMVCLDNLSLVTDSATKILQPCKNVDIINCPKLSMVPQVLSLTVYTKNFDWKNFQHAEQVIVFAESYSIIVNILCSKISIVANDFVSFDKTAEFSIETPRCKITEKNYHSFVETLSTENITREISNKMENCDNFLFAGFYYSNQLENINPLSVTFCNCAGLENFRSNTKSLTLVNCHITEKIFNLKANILILDDESSSIYESFKFSGDLILLS